MQKLCCVCTRQQFSASLVIQKFVPTLLTHISPNSRPFLVGIVSEPDHRFPSQSNEKRGYWVGFADNKGDHLTWKILTDHTNTIIIRSAVRSATKTSPNLRLDPPKGEGQPQDLTSDVFVYGRPNPDGSDNTPPMSIINFDDLLGRTFLLPMDENGERKRATISEHVNDLYQEQVSREDQLRFKLKIDDDQLEDLISYNQPLE